MKNEHSYGVGDASYQAAGCEAGVRQLVNRFYDRMSSDTRFATIFALHPEDIDMSRDKLARFLCGWLGGPKLYNEKYGRISIPRSEEHTSELSHRCISYAVFCLKKKTNRSFL